MGHSIKINTVKIMVCANLNLAVGQLSCISDNSSVESIATDISRKIEILEEQFDYLRSQIINELSVKHNITVEKLLDTLTSLPLSLKKEYESSVVRHISNMNEMEINKLFTIHLNPLLSFIDYGLIEFFIKKFGSEKLKMDMRSYCSEIKLFMK